MVLSCTIELMSFIHPSIHPNTGMCFTSLGPCRRQAGEVGDVRPPAGALAPLEGLLLGVVHLHLHRVYGAVKVEGPQGALRLRLHRRGRRVPLLLLLLAHLTLAVSLVLRHLLGGLPALLLPLVVLIPQAVTLEC